MICGQCDKDLAECVCPDLEQRFNSLLKSQFIFIGDDYAARIRKQIERNKKRTAQTHVTSE